MRFKPDQQNFSKSRVTVDIKRLNEYILKDEKNLQNYVGLHIL